MKHVEIRKASPSDAPEIASVLAESFAEYKSLYTEKGYAATTPNSDAIRKRFAEGATWVAVLEEKIVGTVSVVPENESLYIRSMAILPAARGNRIGERLLAVIEDFAVTDGYRRLLLSTTPFLHRAIRLYEKCGFQRADQLPHELYGTPLVMMSKDLSCRGSMMTTYYAALLRPGKLWNPEKTAREQPFWDEHARFMDNLFDTGVIILGGPFADRSGSLVIVAADNAEQVREMFRTDPWTEQDVLVVGDVREWTIFLDAREKQS